MGRFVAAVVLGFSLVPPALADEMPVRKPGLWEVKTILGHGGRPALTVRQCIDPETDEMMMSSAGPLSQAACRKRAVQRAGDSITVDSTCTLKDRTATAHAVITGSLDSAYTMTVTTQSDALPGGKLTLTMTGKWLGPCLANQKPGDVILPGGFKLNVPEMKRHGLSHGIPLPK